ncbi:MAG: peptide deformylase [Fibrobacterota bacterium]
MRELRLFGDPFLKKRTKEVKAFDELDALIADLFETMYHNDGVGLAANQVGESVSLFVLNATYDRETKTGGTEEVFINPVLLKVYGESCTQEEGCLSVPEIREDVKRKNILDIAYIDRHGEKREEKGVNGVRARIIQHEYDHLHGMLFIDKISAARRLMIRRDLKAIAEGRE